MSRELRITVGQHSDKGRKEINQDFHGVVLPAEPLLGTKGISVVLADGISSSDVSQIAAESAVKSLLTDYYCTSDAWSVKTSAQRVIAAANSWLYSQTRRSQYRYEKDRGYVCAMSALILKSQTAHIFHVGDCRVYRLAGNTLEQLTEDHRVVISSEQSFLGRALGVNEQVEIDYRQTEIAPGDIFVLATDGVYEHAAPRVIAKTIGGHAADLDRAARIVVDEALERGSSDNLTIQIVRIDEIGAGQTDEILGQALELPPPPLLEPRASIDGYRVVREIHGSSRSHIYLALDGDGGSTVVLKTPSIDLRDNAAYLKRFMMEEWVARRLDSPYVLKPRPQTRRRNYLYTVMEFVDGQTLRQWMLDHPRASLEEMRKIVEQVALGLEAFHRMEMLHQDIRPDNIVIDGTGTAKIIDFGSTRVAGVAEAAPAEAGEDILGTIQYAAPEYFLGEPGTPQSDQFSLAVIAYQMLTGHLPYGTQVSRAPSKSAQRKLRYRTAQDHNRSIPVWIDSALRRALHPDPAKRYEALSEFVFDLRNPNPSYLDPAHVPLAERNPVLFWQVLCAVLVCVIVVLLAVQHGMR
jgi:serine/threonine protein phosphatase PrpC